MTGLRVALTPSRRDNLLARVRPAPNRRSATSSAQGHARAAHRSYANDSTVCRMRLHIAFAASGPLAPTRLRRYARAYTYPGLPAFASLSMAGSERQNRRNESGSDPLGHWRRGLANDGDRGRFDEDREVDLRAGRSGLVGSRNLSGRSIRFLRNGLNIAARIPKRAERGEYPVPLGRVLPEKPTNLMQQTYLNTQLRRA